MPDGMQGANNTYWGNIREAISTLLGGISLTLQHIGKAGKRWKNTNVRDDNYFSKANAEGLFTVQYPRESMPVPDNGRYRLHNEIDDCIVCDKCAKICPVDCIEIEGILSPTEIGKTSDGSSKRIHAAKFDIDMGKCCFCGLCTTVCPTECLTMTKAYDFSEYDVADHVYAFAEMTPLQILEKKKEWEEFQQSKKAAQTATQENEAPAKARPKPKMKPKIGGSSAPAIGQDKIQEESANQKPTSPVKPKKAKPVIKKKPEADDTKGEEKPAEEKKPVNKARPKPVIKPRKKE